MSTKWSEVVARLTASGWTQKEIAAAAGTSQSVISDMSRDEFEPRYSIGAAVLALKPKAIA